MRRSVEGAASDVLSIVLGLVLPRVGASAGLLAAVRDVPWCLAPGSGRPKDERNIEPHSQKNAMHLHAQIPTTVSPTHLAIPSTCLNFFAPHDSWKMATAPGSVDSILHFQLLSASYASPGHEAFSHVQKLPFPTSTAPADRVTYLTTLRKAAADMQDHINKELTRRMEDDKLREADSASGEKSIDEGKEEENYGEEVAEEDE
jgi:hypothetical protein